MRVKNPGKGDNNHQRDNDEDDFEGGIEVAEYVNVPDYGLYPPSKSSDGHNTKKSLSNTKGNIFSRSKHFTTLQYVMINKHCQQRILPCREKCLLKTILTMPFN